MDSSQLSLKARGILAVAVEQPASHHQNSFDRLLMAQALTEPMWLLTHDKWAPSYSDTLILI